MAGVRLTVQESIRRLLEANVTSLLLPSGGVGKNFTDDEVPDGQASSFGGPPVSSRGLLPEAPLSNKVMKRREREKKRKEARSAGRLAKWKEGKDKAAVMFRAEGNSFTDAKIGGGYYGAKGVSTPGSMERVVPYAAGVAARIVDPDGRMFAYRGFKGMATDAANAAAIAAANYASANLTSVQTDTKRGNFKKYYFIMHRESVKHPRMHSYFMRNMDAGLHIAQLLQPVLRVAKAAFKQQFPALYEYYAAALGKLCENDASLIAPMFPFASFAINFDHAIAIPHRDGLNFGPGLCCIIPFGDFDPEQDGRIVLVEAGAQIECGPGIPTFIPSALFTHRNTPLVTTRSRGSVVLWTNASLFQYFDLGCRSVNELTREEKAIYDAAVHARIVQGIERFPHVT